MKMNKTDKAIVAFLVSIGLFSIGAATKYVSSLSLSQKNTLMPAVKSSEQIVLLAETYRPTEDPTKKNG